MDEQTKGFIVATCAIVGAGLGILNLCRSYLSDSERVRIALVAGGQDGHSALEVVNVSPFPITITELGEVYADGQTTGIGLEDRPGLPKRIEARHSHRFLITLREAIARQVYADMRRYTFARTALGNVFTNEPRLKRWWRRGKELAHLKKPDLP